MNLKKTQLMSVLPAKPRSRGDEPELLRLLVVQVHKTPLTRG